MSWLSRILNYVPKKERGGLQLELDNAWQLQPVSDAVVFLRALSALSPAGAVLYLECTVEECVEHFLEAHAAGQMVNIAPGVIWPRSDVHHLDLIQDNIEQLIRLINDQGVSFLAHHAHVYARDEIILQWHDAFDRWPMYVSGEVKEERVREFAKLLGVEYSRWEASS